MNRYELDGVIRDLRAGLRVLYIADEQVEAADYFKGIAAELESEASRIVRTNGRQRVELAHGGAFSALSWRSKGGRGLSVDVVLTSRSVLESVGVENVIPLTNTSRAPQSMQLVIQGA